MRCRECTTKTQRHRESITRLESNLSFQFGITLLCAFVSLWLIIPQSLLMRRSVRPPLAPIAKTEAQAAYKPQAHHASLTNEARPGVCERSRCLRVRTFP